MSEGQRHQWPDGQRPARPAPPPPPPPPPPEANERLVTIVIGGGWAVALAVLTIARDALPPASRWWVWTCAAGLGMGLFGLWYVPMLKRRRTHAIGPGAHSFESRDNASKTVSSTETPGRSTKS